MMCRFIFYCCSELLLASSTASQNGFVSSLLRTSPHHKRFLLPDDTINRDHIAKEQLDKYVSCDEEFINIIIPRSQSVYIPIHPGPTKLHSYTGIGAYLHLSTEGMN